MNCPKCNAEMRKLDDGYACTDSVGCGYEVREVAFHNFAPTAQQAPPPPLSPTQEVEQSKWDCNDGTPDGKHWVVEYKDALSLATRLEAAEQIVARFEETITCPVCNGVGEPCPYCCNGAILRVERDEVTLRQQLAAVQLELAKYTTDSGDDSLYNVRRLRRALADATRELAAVGQMKASALQVAKLDLEERNELVRLRGMRADACNAIKAALEWLELDQRTGIKNDTSIAMHLHAALKGLDT